MRLNLMRKTVIGLIRPTVLSSFMTNRMTGIFLWSLPKRIANLWAALDDDKPCLLVCHDMGGVDTAKVNELYDFIQTRCGRKKFKLILAVFNGTVGKCNENIKVYTDNFPCKNYLYMDKFAKFTKAGYHFEEPFVRFCREEVLEMLEN